MSDKRVKFKPMWDAHPAVAHNESNPCLNAKGKPTFTSQCAIRLSIALKAGGVNVKGPMLCGVKGHVMHAINAEQLAGWILGQKVLFGTPEKKVGKDHDAAKGVTVSDYKGKQGVVFFKDFWPRNEKEETGGAKAFTGDHIDLWDGSRQGQGSDNYFQRSKQIWFWPLP